MEQFIGLLIIIDYAVNSKENRVKIYSKQCAHKKATCFYYLHNIGPLCIFKIDFQQWIQFQR